jgi:hypothetical protein
MHRKLTHGVGIANFASRFRWILFLFSFAFSIGCTACSTTPKESASEAPQQPSALPCPVTQTMCTMEYAPVHCVLKLGREELAASDAENSCRGKLILHEKWCKLSANGTKQGKKPQPVIECRSNAN